MAHIASVNVINMCLVIKAVFVVVPALFVVVQALFVETGLFLFVLNFCLEKLNVKWHRHWVCVDVTSIVMSLCRLVQPTVCIC
jgi:hypothetical protein